MRVLCEQFVGAQVGSAKQGGLKQFQFFPEPRRQHRKAHDFDQADVFLFDVMKLGMRVEDSERVFFRRDIVPQDQIELVSASSAARYRGYGIVRFAFGFGEYKR